MRCRRLVVAAAVACVVAGSALVVGADPAAAHASLVGSSPAPGAIAADHPRAISLRFTEPVEVDEDAIAVTAPDGSPVAGLRAATDPADRATVSAALPGGLAPGTYAVRWQVLSIDGHPVQGEFRFAQTSPTAPLDAPAAPGAAGPSTMAVVGRAAAAAGALAVVGLAVFPLLVLRPARRRLTAPVWAALEGETARRLRAPLVVAVVVALAGTALTVVDTVAQTTPGGVPTVGELTAFLTGTRTGILLGLRLVLFVVAGVFLVRGLIALPASRLRLAVGSTAAAVGLVTFSLSSHAAAAPADRALAVGFNVLHLAAAGLWVGGLLGLALAGIPAARRVGGSNHRIVGDAAGALAASFSVAAQLAMLAVLTTGGYLALLQVAAVEELTETAWGVALTIKVALWVTVLLFASANAIAFVPRLAERASKAKQRSAASDELGSSVRLELLAAGSLIVVAAVMSATPPPASTGGTTVAVAAPTERPRTTSATSDRSGYTTRVQVSRSGTGETAATVFRVQLTTQGTRASSPRVDALLRSAGGGVQRIMALDLVGEGEWVSRRLSVEPGRYRFTARFLRAGETVAIPVDVTVPT